MRRGLRVRGKEQGEGLFVGHAGLAQAVGVLEHAHRAGGGAAVVAVRLGYAAAQVQQAGLQAGHVGAAGTGLECTAHRNEAVGIQVGLEQRIRHAVHLGHGFKGLRGLHRLRTGLRSGFLGGFLRGHRGVLGHEGQLVLGFRGGRCRRGGHGGRGGRGRGGLHRTRVNQRLLQLPHVILQRLHGKLRALAEVAVGPVVEEAHLDQALLQPLGGLAVLAQLKLRIEGRGHADVRNLDRLVCPLRQRAVRIRLRGLACRADRLVDGLGEGLGVAACGAGGLGHNAAQPLLDLAPVRLRVANDLKHKLAAVGHIVHRHLAGHVPLRDIYALIIGIFILDVRRAGHVRRVH